MKSSSVALPRSFFALLMAGGTAVTHAAALPEKVSFNEHIRPILSDKCFACHGFDVKHRKAGLRLDIPEGAYKPNDDNVPAIKPGDLKASGAWERITTADEDDVMPPKDSHKTLSAAEKDLLKRWIEQGASYQKHWAFEAPVQAPVPKVAGNAGLSAIDAFIAARLEKEKLKMAPEADRETLARRVSFALTGLPPSTAELDTFLADTAPDGYERYVDRLLASPRFGEEMARHWLDIARYGDTHGLHLDNERQMWAYRDWVIQAFNSNKHYDQFTIEQLAGDLLPGATQDQLVATGFNRCNVTTSEGGSIAEEFIFRYAVDRASTTVQAWMGLTAGCAVCHDHQFDPLTTKEFYSIYSFFQSNADPAMDGNALLTRPTLKLAKPEQEKQLEEFDAKLAAAQKQFDERVAEASYTDPATLNPTPPVQEVEQVWVEDDFPAGAKVKTNVGDHPTTWVTAETGQVFSGQRALKRTSKGLAQDFYDSGAVSFDVPVGARFFVNVYLDPADPPEAVMVQFNTGTWKNRAVWGDAEKIPYGRAGTTERYAAGPLPDASKWVRLEVDAEKLGLSPGDKVNGIAFTLFGGTAYFDQLGVLGRTDPAADPAHSFLAWQKKNAGKDTPGLPAEINKLVKDGPKKARKPADEKKLRDYYLGFVCAATREAFQPLAKELGELKKKREAFDAAIPATFIWKDLETPRDSFVMVRGQYDKPGEKVEPGTPAVLPPLKKANPDGRATRLDFAKWLMSPEHPLTARVAVNRLWQQFFGVGLVKTTGDFGSQGQPPSHPELLDWLAVHFRDSGWDVKSLVRELVTSAAFRQASVVTPELVQHDPENRLLARGPRFRLDAEQVRDNALYVSGLINLEMGGKGVRTYQPANIWEPVGFAGSNTRYYKQDSGGALYRRSIYSFLKRTAPPPFMVNFDAPSREGICTGRERSNTPMQALQLLNDVQHVEAARALGQRMLTEGGASPAERIAFAFRTTLARKPEAAESDILQKQLTTHLTRYQEDAEAANKLITAGESKPRPELPPQELAAYTLVANSILNLDETVTRN